MLATGRIPYSERKKIKMKENFFSHILPKKREVNEIKVWYFNFSCEKVQNRQAVYFKFSVKNIYFRITEYWYWMDT